MRLDWELLVQAEESTSPATWIRFYRWECPTVSLGKHQRAETAVCLNTCGELAIPLVHRPTGGRAVLHADEVTYAVVSNDPTLTLGRSIQPSYARIAEGLAAGLGRMGLKADLVSAGTSPPRVEGLIPPCFVTHSRFELTWQGRKLAGSAQRRLRRSFLQHGSLPLSIDYPGMGRVFRTPPDLLRSQVCSLQEALGRKPGFEETCEMLTRGFREVLGRLPAAGAEDWEVESQQPDAMLG